MFKILSHVQVLIWPYIWTSKLIGHDSFKTKYLSFSVSKICKPLQVLLALILISVVFTPNASAENASVANARATGVLSLLDFEFNLNEDEAVRRGTKPHARVRIGSGTLGRSDVQTNFRRGLLRGPRDPLNPLDPYAIHMYVGPVTASAPPPERSLFLHKRTGFFTFFNFSENPQDITLYWNANYSLTASGDFSASSILVRTRQTTERGTVTDTVLFSDQVSNDDEKLLIRPTGQLVVSLDPATRVGDSTRPSWTRLRIDAEVQAEATVPIPEPTAMLLLGTGLAGVASAARRRHKAKKREGGG